MIQATRICIVLLVFFLVEGAVTIFYVPTVASTEVIASGTLLQNGYQAGGGANRSFGFNGGVTSYLLSKYRYTLSGQTYTGYAFELGFERTPNEYSVVYFNPIIASLSVKERGFRLIPIAFLLLILLGLKSIQGWLRSIVKP